MSATHYVHRNSGQKVFVKEAAFFLSQGGLYEEWGRGWTPVVATSIEDARRIGEWTLPIKLCKTRVWDSGDITSCDGYVASDGKCRDHGGKLEGWGRDVKDFRIGDRVDGGFDNTGTVISIDDKVQVRWDGETDSVAPGDIRLLKEDGE